MSQGNSSELSFEGLGVVTDPTPADWFIQRLRPWGKGLIGVASLVPDGYEAYGRVLPPARRTDRPGKLRWSSIAEERGVAMAPEVRFTSLIGWDPAHDGHDAPQPYVAPRWGTLEHDECARLAEVILDQEGGVPTALAIVDYKTSTTGDVADHALQLQVYTDAGRREGLDVRAAYVHDLKAAERTPYPSTFPP